MKTIKKIISFLFVLAMGTALFAQSEDAHCYKISDSDCINFSKNFNKITEELDKMDIDINENASYAKQAADAAKVEATLAKYGISGENRLAKVLMITSGSTIITYEATMKANPLAKAFLGGEDPMESLKETINTEDYKVIKRNYSAIYTAISGEAPAEVPEAKDNSSKKKNGKWTDEDTQELKDYAKEEVKNAAKDALKSNIKKGLRNFF